MSSEHRLYCVFDVTHCSADVCYVCCVGFSGSRDHTFPRADATETSRNVNLYNASAMRFSTFVHDLITLQTPEGQNRTAELRFYRSSLVQRLRAFRRPVSRRAYDDLKGNASSPVPIALASSEGLVGMKVDND